MTFAFFGIFADQASELSEQITNVWPDANTVMIATPFEGLAARLPNRLYSPELEDTPEEIARIVRDISANNPRSKFVLLRVNCWGGDCFEWGEVIHNGATVERIDGEQALRRLILVFGTDIGPRQFFAPLLRDFAWSR